MTAEAAFWDNPAEEYARKPVENPDAFDRKIRVTQSRMTTPPSSSLPSPRPFSRPRSPMASRSVISAHGLAGMGEGFGSHE